MDTFNKMPPTQPPIRRGITATRLKALTDVPRPLAEQTTLHGEALMPQASPAQERESATERSTQREETVAPQNAQPEEQEAFIDRPTQQVQTIVPRRMAAQERESLVEQAAVWQDTLAEEWRDLDVFHGEWPTRPMQIVPAQEPLTGPLAHPPSAVAKKRGRWLLYGLSLLLVILIISGVVLGPAVYHRVFSSRQTASRPNLQHVLHPQTALMQSDEVNNAVHQFMGDMLRKNWIGMWPMLAPEAQSVWQGETDFTHFEQAKFGLLTLQSYTLGQTMTSSPWLNPDTTLVHTSAVTLSIALQASAPAGLLTPPSNSALSQGLFKNTLFALSKNSQGTWQVLVAGPADLEAPVLVPAKLPTSNSSDLNIPTLQPVETSLAHVILPIFMYHHISSKPTHNLLDFSLTVTPGEFNKELDWLQQQGYQSITMNELFSAFYYGKALPSKPMILTFDDGYADVYTYALPALLAHHDRGVFYIITGMIGGRNMTWDQIKTMAHSGMEIADHTIHHISLDEYPYTTARTTPQQELVDSKATLESELGTPIQFFCYPSGEPFHHGSQAARQRILQYLFEDGYVGATLDPSVTDSALQVAATPYQMPRIRVSGGENLANFIGILKTTLQLDARRARSLQS